ncbi:hypothetical protein HT031_005548 [Scenedesmus sp. PABB004]|nr:hypothetical protein HT031_005548 [Scenedesmus sp. PABB004]
MARTDRVARRVLRPLGRKLLALQGFSDSHAADPAAVRAALERPALSAEQEAELDAEMQRLFAEVYLPEMRGVLDDLGLEVADPDAAWEEFGQEVMARAAPPPKPPVRAAAVAVPAALAGAAVALGVSTAARWLRRRRRAARSGSCGSVASDASAYSDSWRVVTTPGPAAPPGAVAPSLRPARSAQGELPATASVLWPFNQLSAAARAAVAAGPQPAVGFALASGWPAPAVACSSAGQHAAPQPPAVTTGTTAAPAAPGANGAEQGQLVGGDASSGGQGWQTGACSDVAAGDGGGARAQTLRRFRLKQKTTLHALEVERQTKEAACAQLSVQRAALQARVVVLEQLGEAAEALAAALAAARRPPPAAAALHSEAPALAAVALAGRQHSATGSGGAALQLVSPFAGVPAASGLSAASTGPAAPAGDHASFVAALAPRLAAWQLQQQQLQLGALAWQPAGGAGGGGSDQAPRGMPPLLALAQEDEAMSRAISAGLLRHHAAALAGPLPLADLAEPAGHAAGDGLWAELARLVHTRCEPELVERLCVADDLWRRAGERAARGVREQLALAAALQAGGGWRAGGAELDDSLAAAQRGLRGAATAARVCELAVLRLLPGMLAAELLVRAAPRRLDVAALLTELVALQKGQPRLAPQA